MLTWRRCDSAVCWCALAPRVIASTGVPYTVEECPPDYRAVLLPEAKVKRSLWFRYVYLGGAA